MLFNISKWALAATFITSALSSPITSSNTKAVFARDQKTYGIRYMSEDEATATKNNGNKLVVEDKRGGELGIGKYVTTYTYSFEYDNYYAFIKIDDDKWEDVKKVWIPRRAKLDADDDDASEIDLYNNEENIKKYIESLGEDPKKCIRMKAEKKDWGQFLIPPELIKELEPAAEPVDKRQKKPEEIKINMLDWDEQVNKPKNDDDDDDGGIFDFEPRK